jgi:hypothetical protein
MPLAPRASANGFNLECRQIFGIKPLILTLPAWTTALARQIDCPDIQTK